MKFKTLVKTGQTADNDAILKTEFQTAKQVGEGRIGETHLFYRYFLRVKYIAYTEIQKAFLRVESGECGEFLLQEFYLILVTKEAEECRLRFERKENIQTILDYLTAQNPDIEIGYKKERKK